MQSQLLNRSCGIMMWPQRSCLLNRGQTVTSSGESMSYIDSLMVRSESEDAVS